MPNVLSIFSGGGGIDCGFKKAGFDICFSTDFWKPACDTLEKNKVGKLVVCDDILRIQSPDSIARRKNWHLRTRIPSRCMSTLERWMK